MRRATSCQAASTVSICFSPAKRPTKMARGASGNPNRRRTSASRARRAGWKRSRSTPSDTRCTRFHPFPLQAASDGLARDEDGAIEAGRVAARRPTRRCRRSFAGDRSDAGVDDRREMGVIEPDQWRMQVPVGASRHPGHEPGAADFDQVGTFVLEDAPGGTRGQQEPVGLVERNAGPAQAIAANPALLSQGIDFTGDNQDLAQLRLRLDIGGLGEEIRPDPTGGVAEVLGDIENGEASGPADGWRKVGTGEVEWRPGWRQETRWRGGGRFSLSSHRGDRPCRSWSRGSCSPRGGRDGEAATIAGGRADRRTGGPTVTTPAVEAESRNTYGHSVRWSAGPPVRATHDETPRSETDWSSAPPRWWFRGRGRCRRWSNRAAP